MDEPSLGTRVHHFLVIGFFLERENMLREKFEWTGQVRFERAHGPRARTLWARLAMKRRRVGRRSVRAERSPSLRLVSKHVEADRIYGKRVLERRRRLFVRCTHDPREPRAGDLLEQRRRLDQGLVVERHGRDRDAA